MFVVEHAWTVVVGVVWSFVIVGGELTVGAWPSGIGCITSPHTHPLRNYLCYVRRVLDHYDDILVVDFHREGQCMLL